MIRLLLAFLPVFHWQSRAVLARHVRVHVRKWHTALLPPVCEPLILLLAFGVGLGQQMESLAWQGQPMNYLTYLAPGILAYTAFMTSFFQSLFSAYIRMHYQKSWEGQLTTQVRLEHVIWGEALWAAGLATVYAAILALVLCGFGAIGWLDLVWWWLPLVLPILFIAALGFASLGLWFTAMIPSMDHMGLPFFLVIMPIAFASSTYFPLPDVVGLHEIALFNPLNHLAEGLRHLLILGQPTWHFLWALVLSLVMMIIFIPIDLKLLRRRVLGEG